VDNTANPPPPSPSTSSQSRSSSNTFQETTPTEGAHGGGALDTSPSAAPGGSPSSPLSDDQILHVLHTANTGEIEQARMAQKQAKNARVKQFAAMMIKDHSQADKNGNDVAKKTNTSPTANDVSRNLEKDAKQMTSAMSDQKGSDFDRSYIDAQVKEHQAVLDLIDKQLLPDAKSAEVKSTLQALRPKIEGHLKEAKDIQKAL
jgi:putative membrane protein